MTLREITNLGWYLLRPEGEDDARLIEPLLYGRSRGERICAAQLKTGLWLGLSVLFSIGISLLH